jgi:hypothetical protein
LFFWVFFVFFGFLSCHFSTKNCFK